MIAEGLPLASSLKTWSGFEVFKLNGKPKISQYLRTQHGVLHCYYFFRNSNKTSYPLGDIWSPLNPPSFVEYFKDKGCVLTSQKRINMFLINNDCFREKIFSLNIESGAKQLDWLQLSCKLSLYRTWEIKLEFYLM